MKINVQYVLAVSNHYLFDYSDIRYITTAIGYEFSGSWLYHSPRRLQAEKSH